MLRKRFMVLETNLPGVQIGHKGDHFICTTQIGTKTQIFSHPTKFRCTMFDGLRVKLVAGEDYYIIGEVHG